MLKKNLSQMFITLNQLTSFSELTLHSYQRNEPNLPRSTFLPKFNSYRRHGVVLQRLLVLYKVNQKSFI